VTEYGHLPPPPDVKTQREIRKRDGNKCCITGRAGTIWDPLIIVPVVPVPSGWVSNQVGVNALLKMPPYQRLTDSRPKPNIPGMLGVFFSPPYRDWWLSYASNPGRMPHCQNHWLVQKSAARAFAQGYVKLIRQPPSMIMVRWNWQAPVS
jgi:hypothetical protein